MMKYLNKGYKVINQQDILILGIETSCDETSVAVVKNGRYVLSNIVSSQIDIHKRFGGVVPEVASRNHTLTINGVFEQALKDAGITLNDLTAIAVTYGAGLSGALLVGISFAKAISYALSIPLIKVNHIKGHIAANYISSKIKPPFICLVVSGGHTAILEVLSYTKHKLIGTTIDDACGEAFDKVARVLGLPYPGGAEIDKLSKKGKPVIEFPKMLKNNKDFNFSYSGLKTAVINYVHNQKQKNQELNRADLCASFTVAAVDPLIEKSIKVCKKYGYNTLCIAGGVSANSYLRENIVKAGKENNIKVFIPDLNLCTDNAAMIAAEGYYNYISGENIADLSLNAVPSLKL